MSGLYLLLVAAVWLALSVATAYAITSRIKDAVLRVVAMLALTGLLLPLPLVDELVGKWQFEQLCKDNSTIQVDRARAVGKTVYFVPQPTVDVTGTWVRVALRPHKFVDVVTGESVISYNELMASGGRLSRALGISEGGVPLTFVGSCALDENPRALFKSLNVSVMDRPN
jgi:hypothetical protein